MRLGLHIGYWGLGLTADEQLRQVREAESLGFDSVWSAEAYGSDAATVLGWLAGQTETIKLGSARPNERREQRRRSLRRARCSEIARSSSSPDELARLSSRRSTRIAT